jgi:hypothetical protein
MPARCYNKFLAELFSARPPLFEIEKKDPQSGPLKNLGREKKN